jgi:hypothetical protein
MKNKLIRALGISLASVTLVASVGTMSMAASQTNGSDDPLHIYTAAGVLINPSTPIAWTTNINASTSSTGLAALTCPAPSTGYRLFISPRGQEKTLANHDAYRALTGSTVDQYLNISPSQANIGGALAIRDNGGSKSLGVACTNGTDVVKAYFRHITVSAGGSFLAAATVDVAVTPSPTPETATSTTANRDGSVPLTATTIASADGTLSLSVPQGAAVTFGTATLVNNKSTSTGTLPQVTVTDERYSSKLGWSVGASWTDFVSGGGNIIGKANLAIVPSIVGITNGVTVASTPLAGLSVASSYNIAEATLNNGVGTTTIGGQLTFAAPIASPAGTYTSTLTLTLVSK